MVFRTLARRGSAWFILPFEVELVPGLPVVHFLNASDGFLKESIVRIRTVFRRQGLSWPKTQSLVINFRINHSDWQSDGIDLALTIAILVRLGAFRPTRFKPDHLVAYGALRLSGEFECPRDLSTCAVACENLLVGSRLQDVTQTAVVCDSFSGLLEESFQNYTPQISPPIRPPLPTVRWSAAAAKIMIVAATGEHSIFLGGAHGSGKSTFAECIHHVLSPPSASLWCEILRWGHLFRDSPGYRPFRSPHHTTPVRSLLGGCKPIVPGEITRAHGGVLLLDEFLEFHREVQEGLREPLEKREIHLSRGGEAVRFPARFVLIATSNLCPCGLLSPGRTTSCQFSLLRCRSVLDRLSGPVLDRMEILAFPHRWAQSEGTSLTEVAEAVDHARDFAARERQQTEANSQLSLAELESQMDSAARLVMTAGHAMAPRRRRALLRVARTLADIAESPFIGLAHLDDAYLLVEKPRIELAQLFA
jgi:magnesium chelatase family protein